MEKSQNKRKKAAYRSWLRKHTMAVLIAVITLLVAIGGLSIFCMQSYSGPDQWIYIPAGATPASIRDSLRAHLGSVDANRIYLLWRLQRGHAATAHGAYLLNHGEKALAVARRLKYGRQTPVKVSFSNVRTLDQLAERATRNLACTPEQFIEACGRVLPEQGFAPAEFPAAFLPDSYEFYWDATPDRVVSRLLEYRNKYWNESRRARAKQLGLTPVQVATLASIVEEESAKTDERPRIARMYLNRLDKKMPLQADPTVKFAVGDFSLRRIRAEHLKTVSPYNTYLNPGLPPGPIRIPDKATLEGVLNAPDHDYLYMCAKEDFSGYHNFARDYSTHMANARRYHAELNRRNIK